MNVDNLYHLSGGLIDLTFTAILVLLFLLFSGDLSSSVSVSSHDSLESFISVSWVDELLFGLFKKGLLSFIVCGAATIFSTVALGLIGSRCGRKGCEAILIILRHTGLIKFFL